MNALLDALRAAVPAGAPRPRVFIQVKDRPPTAAGPGLCALVEAAGGVPFLVNPGFSGDGGLELSWEELMEFDPQLVVLALEGRGLAADPAEFLAIEGWDRTEAARTRKVFSWDETLLQGEPAGWQAAGRLLQSLIAEVAWGGSAVTDAALRRLK